MKLSQLVGKEIINLSDGARLGVTNESQFIIDTESGKIHSITISVKKSVGMFSKTVDSLVIPWSSVKRVGEDLLIVEIPEYSMKGKKGI